MKESIQEKFFRFRLLDRNRQGKKIANGNCWEFSFSTTFKNATQKLHAVTCTVLITQ